MEEDYKTLVVKLSLIILALASIASRLFAVYFIWNWIVSPITNLNTISLLHAFALGWFFTLFNISGEAYKETDDYDTMKLFYRRIVNHGICVLVAYILTYFI